MGKNKSSKQKTKTRESISNSKDIDDEKYSCFSVIGDMINLLWYPKEKEELLSRMNKVLEEVNLNDLEKTIQKYYNCVKNLVLIEQHITIHIARIMFVIESCFNKDHERLMHIVLAETAIARVFMHLITENDIFNVELKHVKKDFLDYQYTLNMLHKLYPLDHINQEYLTEVEMIKRLNVEVSHFDIPKARLKDSKCKNDNTSGFKNSVNKSLDVKSMKMNHSNPKTIDFKQSDKSQIKLKEPKEKINETKMEKIRPSKILPNKAEITLKKPINNKYIKEKNKLESNKEINSIASDIPESIVLCENKIENGYHKISEELKPNKLENEKLYKKVSENEFNNPWLIDNLIYKQQNIDFENEEKFSRILPLNTSSIDDEELKENTGNLSKLSTVKQVVKDFPTCQNDDEMFEESITDDNVIDNTNTNLLTDEKDKKIVDMKACNKLNTTKPNHVENINDNYDNKSSEKTINGKKHAPHCIHISHNLIKNEYTPDFFDRLEKENINNESCVINNKYSNIEIQRDECYAVELNNVCGKFKCLNASGYFRRMLPNGTDTWSTLSNSSLEIECLKCKNFVVDRLTYEDLTSLFNEMGDFLSCEIQGVIFKVKNLRYTTLTLTGVSGCSLNIYDDFSKSTFLSLNDEDIKLFFSNGEFVKVNVIDISILKIIKFDENTNISNEKNEVSIENNGNIEKEKHTFQFSAKDLKESTPSQEKNCEEHKISCIDNSNTLEKKDNQTNNKPSCYEIGIRAASSKYKRTVINPIKYNNYMRNIPCTGKVINHQKNKPENERDEQVIEVVSIGEYDNPSWEETKKMLDTEPNRVAFFNESFRNPDDDDFNDTFEKPVLTSFYPKTTVDYIKNNIDEIMKLTAYSSVCLENGLLNAKVRNNVQARLVISVLRSNDFDSFYERKTPLKELYTTLATYINCQIEQYNSSVYKEKRINWSIYTVRLIGTLRIITQQLVIREILHSLGFETLSQERIYKDSMKDLKKESTGLDLHIYDHDDENDIKLKRVKWKNGNYVHIELV